jgi:hypothetical protein
VRRHRLIARLSAAREKARSRSSAITLLSLIPPAPPIVVEVEEAYECVSCRHRFVAFVLRPCPACAGRVVHRRS